MAAPATADDFLVVLSRSNLIDADCLDDFLQRLPLVPEHAEQLAEQLTQASLLTPFQVRHLLEGRWLRFFIGPYKVLDRIGSGCFGAVYLCEHQRLRQRVAIKVLLGKRAQDHDSVLRFNREARATATLDHPNVVRAFDLGCMDGLHYLVMEYVDGVSLQQLVQTEGLLSSRRAADFLRQAALGLQHAHEAGLVHRDLKPSNLMVDRNGVVKVLDLGLARFVEDDMDLTRGAVVGSPAYMAPEQALDSHHVDGRADIYALGATFFECLTGRPPQAESLLTPLPRPSTPGASRGLNRLLDLLRRMMASAAADRPQSAAAVAAEIAGWSGSQLSRADAPTTRYRACAAKTEPVVAPRRATKVAKGIYGKASAGPGSPDDSSRTVGSTPPRARTVSHHTPVDLRKWSGPGARPAWRRLGTTHRSTAENESVLAQGQPAARLGCGTRWLWLAVGAALTGVLVLVGSLVLGLLEPAKAPPRKVPSVVSGTGATENRPVPAAGP
jgi:serine/threonine protein kinase